MLSFLRSPRAMVPCALVAMTIALPAASASAADTTTASASTCVKTGVLPIGTCSAPAAPSGGCAYSDLEPSRTNARRIRSATLCLLNKERAKHGLRPLKAQSTLRVVAKRFATKMVREGFFDHTSPSGSTMIARIKSTPYLSGSLRRWSVGENLAWGTGELATPANIMDAWMASPGHRANILDRDFREVGIAAIPGAPTSVPGGATYVTEFGLRVRP